MTKAVFMLSFALLLSLAYSSGFSACFPYPSAVGFNVQNTTYPGSFGNYSVYVQAFPPPSLIRVEGPDASKNALIGEIALLQNEKMLETKCNVTQVQMYSYANYACSPDGTWQDADQTNLCEQAALPAMAVTDNAAKTGSAEQANAPIVPPEPGAGTAPTAERAYGATTGAAGQGAPEAAPQAPSAGITLETILPLAAGFLAVVVLSYLVLQQRQVQIEITVEEQRLLENETRAGIMQELTEAERIPTDLSNKLHKSKATIVEHLEVLANAGFVEKLATPGKKFVYYRLSHKGRIAVLRKAS